MFVSNRELMRAANVRPASSANAPNPKCCSDPRYLCDHCRSMVTVDNVGLPLPPPSCAFNYGPVGAEIEATLNAKAEGSNADAVGDASALMRAGRGRVPQDEAKAYWDPTVKKGKGEEKEDDDLAWLESENRLRLQFGSEKEPDPGDLADGKVEGVRADRTKKLVRQA
jgi:hypothetical protein